MVKTVTIRLRDAQYSALEKLGKPTPTAEAAVTGFLELRKYALYELKGLFTKEEWTAMIDAQNGTMLVEDYQANVGVFIAHCEDFENLESGFSRHGADFKQFAEKLAKLTSAQVFFLQLEIALFWETAHERDLYDFIENVR